MTFFLVFTHGGFSKQSVIVIFTQNFQKTADDLFFMRETNNLSSTSIECGKLHLQTSL